MKEKINFRELALKIATKAHMGQIDKAGKPYIEHPLKVASAFNDDERYITALLHDVVEDSEMTIDDLRTEGFEESILQAIQIITKTDISYEEYIMKIKNNPIAREVKIEDLKHNMDLSRLNRVTNRDLKRVEKYKKSLDFLMN